MSTSPARIPPPVRSVRWRIVGGAVATAMLAVATAAVVDAPASASLPSPPAGWTQVWADDFTGSAGALPSSGNWLFDIGHGYPGGPNNWGTNEIEYMTNNPANVSLDGSGNLRITPIRDGSGNWTSARIETQRSDFQPSSTGVMRVEGRMQLPNVSGAAAQGIWPAFWSMGAPFRPNYTGWPSIGEVDIMENVNGANQVWGTLHCGYAPAGPCNEFSGLGGNRVMGSPSLQSAFHTYAVELDRSVSPQQLRWYVDGSLFHTVNSSQVDATTWNNATNHGFFLILNVAIGGDWPGGPTSSTASGVPMIVDYVAVYTKGGGGGGTTTPPPTGGTGAYGTIQAESYNGQGGVGVEATTDSGGGQNIASLANGDWAQYNNIDFGSSAARQFVARVASGAAGGVSGLVEVRLDSRSNAPIGSFSLANTGGWQSWRTVPANISGVTGVHTVYLTFTSGQPADFVNVNWFTFGH